MRKRFGVLTVLSCSLFSMNSFAANLYVSANSPNASDATTNKGTDSNVPLKSIQRAAAIAVAGDTVHVAAGTYNVSAPGLGNYGILLRASGTATSHIRFVSDPKNRAKIVMSGTGMAWDIKGSYVDIDGFEITGSGRSGILTEGAHYSITNNYIHDLTVSGGCNGSGGAAIDTWGTVGDAIIANNIVRNIGNNLGPCNTVQGIYIASPANVVINNVVSGVIAVGIHQWHGATSSVIINNTVFHNKEGILIGNGDGGALPNGSENNYVANNIVYDNSAYGIIEYGKVGAGNRYVNNLAYKSGTNVKMLKGSVSGTIQKDPLFVNYQANGSGDYHLQSTSPAINQGAAASAPLTDFDGYARQGGIDLGAYEYHSASSGGGGSTSTAPVFTTSYSVLKTYHPLCDGSVGISMPCNAAVDDFCQAKGYKAGGFGPVEHNGDMAQVVCVNTGQAARFQTTLTALRGYQSLCNPNNPMSVECASAVNRFCQQGHNYAAGGFGPVQIMNDNVTVVCVTGSEAVYRSDSWATLAASQEACTGQPMAPLDVCKAAVHRRCQTLNNSSGAKYVAGFGILEMTNSAAYFSCLKY